MLCPRASSAFTSSIQNILDVKALEAQGHNIAEIGRPGSPPHLVMRSGNSTSNLHMHQPNNEAIDDPYLLGNGLPFSLAETQHITLNHHTNGTVGLNSGLFDIEADVEYSQFLDFPFDLNPNVVTDTPQTAIPELEITQENTVNSWPAFQNLNDSFDPINTDHGNTSGIAENATNRLDMGSTVDIITTKASQTIERPERNGHIIVQFCDLGSDPTDFNNLLWYQKKLQNGNIITTKLLCSTTSIPNSDSSDSMTCSGGCLCDLNLGCRLGGCPFQYRPFADEQHMRTHIQMHLNPPTPTAQLNSENLQIFLSHYAPPSPDRSWRQPSMVSWGDATAYSESSLGRSPGSRWDEIHLQLRNGTQISIAGSSSPTRSHRSTSEFSYSNSTDVYLTSNASQDERRPLAKPIKPRRKLELLCPYETCSRSKKGNGFGRSDNLLDHRRKVHEENIPRLPKGRKKGMRPA